jgi:hypothetical protein
MERRMKRKTPIPVAAALALLCVGPLNGQLTVTVGAVKTEALGGQWGGDARLWVEPPGSPLGVYLGAEYFLPDCPEECSLWGWRAGGYLRWVLPALDPYLTGAYVVQELDQGGGRSGNVGLALGIGARLHLPIDAFAEATWEVFDGSPDGWSLRFGIGF